jgi:predicted DNA-binding protein (MmcQ/YjbR family)
MTIEDLQEIASQFPGFSQSIKWESNLCLCVAQKIFTIISLDTTPISVSFKVQPDDFEMLTQMPEFVPAPYLARSHWVMVSDISLISKEKWAYFMLGSYTLIKAKLPKKAQELLNIGL